MKPVYNGMSFKRNMKKNFYVIWRMQEDDFITSKLRMSDEEWDSLTRDTLFETLYELEYPKRYGYPPFDPAQKYEIVSMFSAENLEWEYVL